MTDMAMRKGTEFTHPRLLDPTWKPGAGQTYGDDAPHARCVITSVRLGSVFYRYAHMDGPAVFLEPVELLADAIGKG